MGVSAAEEHSTSIHGSSSSSLQERDLDSIETTKPSIYVWLVTLASAIGKRSMKSQLDQNLTAIQVDCYTVTIRKAALITQSNRFGY